MIPEIVLSALLLKEQVEPKKHHDAAHQQKPEDGTEHIPEESASAEPALSISAEAKPHGQEPIPNKIIMVRAENPRPFAGRVTINKPTLC